MEKRVLLNFVRRVQVFLGAGERWAVAIEVWAVHVLDAAPPAVPSVFIQRKQYHHHLAVVRRNAILNFQRLM